MYMENSMELDAMKAVLAREILNTDSSEILKKVRKVFEHAKKSENVLPPCQYTVEELKERVRKGMQDARAGQGVTNIVAVWDCRQNPDKLSEKLVR